MKINDIDVSTFGGRQWNVTPGFVTVKNNSEWVAGAPTPSLTDSYIQMASLKVAILIRGNSRDEILLKCSNLIAQLMSPVTIELDGFTRQFVGAVSKWDLTESSRKRFHLLTIEASGYWEDVTEFDDYCYGPVTNPGNLRTPVRIVFLVSENTDLLTITGAGADITVSDVEVGDWISLNGQTGVFTINDQVDDRINAWELPTLAPGNNEIIILPAAEFLTLKFRPRYV